MTPNSWLSGEHDGPLQGILQPPGPCLALRRRRTGSPARTDPSGCGQRSHDDRPLPGRPAASLARCHIHNPNYTGTCGGGQLGARPVISACTVTERGTMMTNDTQSFTSPTEGAKLLVRILARRRRATGEPDLRVIFEREGGIAVEFALAMQHALRHGWITRRADGLLTGSPSRQGREAAGLR
jgi:hypothetical protein